MQSVSAQQHTHCHIHTTVLILPSHCSINAACTTLPHLCNCSHAADHMQQHLFHCSHATALVQQHSTLSTTHACWSRSRGRKGVCYFFAAGCPFRGCSLCVCVWGGGRGVCVHIPERGVRQRSKEQGLKVGFWAKRDPSAQKETSSELKTRKVGKSALE